MQETCIEDTQLLIYFTDALKHKLVFIAGFLTYKHGEPVEGEEVSSEFLQELDRGWLRLPTLNTTCKYNFFDILLYSIKISFDVNIHLEAL